jgi:signal transduction histidine kinase
VSPEQAVRKPLIDVIAMDHDAIVARWLAVAGHAASARGLDEPALTDVIPKYLAALASGSTGRELVENHFSTRLRQGFQLAEIVDEFVLLGRCIVERCFALPESIRPLATEIDDLHEKLHQASATVVAMFDAHMREDEQTDKRYVRLLQGVASAALRAGTSALTESLRDILGLVMDAMDAQSAAILIHDAEGRLIKSATVGAEILEEYATKEGNHSLAAAIAESETPMALWDVTSTELDVSNALRESGIHSVLGVQLKSSSGVFGVLYVGVATTRTFTAREKRRLETLAEQLVVHLGGAALFDRLSSTIAELRRERSIREHLVAILAHDLRGPLAAAKLGAELLVEEPARLDARRDLGARIERNLDRMDRMIRDLLDASRVRAGERLALQRLDRCDLVQLTRDVAEELRMVYGDRFVVESDPLVEGMWSADELRRTLWNLGVNAVKYGAKDQPIELRVHRLDGHALAAVHNWGTPIAPEDQKHMFDPFARTRTGVESGTVGWGLGLALVAGCAEAHGGTVRVTSNAEEGTTFTITIPLDARPYQQAPTESHAVH